MSNGGAKPHRKLKVWQKSIDFVAEIYAKSRVFPVEERFGLISQIQRCACSIPANIAEGAARKSTKEYRHFLYIARGSLSEIDTYLEICLKLGYLNEAEYLALNEKLSEMSKMLNGLIKSLASKQ